MSGPSRDNSSAETLQSFGDKGQPKGEGSSEKEVLSHMGHPPYACSLTQTTRSVSQPSKWKGIYYTVYLQSMRHGQPELRDVLPLIVIRRSYHQAKAGQYPWALERGCHKSQPRENQMLSKSLEVPCFWTCLLQSKTWPPRSSQLTQESESQGKPHESD